PLCSPSSCFHSLFTPPAPTEICTLSLHDALPISCGHFLIPLEHSKRQAWNTKLPFNVMHRASRSLTLQLRMTRFTHRGLLFHDTVSVKWTSGITFLSTNFLNSMLTLY